MSEIDMNGKVVLITGANSGIGKEATGGLARMGATVVMVARSEERGAAAQQEVIEQSGNKEVHLLLADLADQSQIRALADTFIDRFDRLDVLINNAGVIMGSRTLSPDGIETTFAVNHLAYFLLTQLLLDMLKASAPARVINVASEAHRMGWIDFKNLQGEKRYNEWTAYGTSKLANIMFTYELAERLRGTGVTANVMHPGTVNTNFGGEGSLFMRSLWKLAAPIKVSPKQGAGTILYLATSPQIEGVTGRYFIRKQSRDSSDVSYDRSTWKRLWALSEELTGLAAVSSP